MNSARILSNLLGLPQPRCCVDRRLPAPEGVDRFALLTASQWTPGQTLRIAFSGGYPSDRTSVMRAAAEWTRFANLTIVQVMEGYSELRCSFNSMSGSWSFIGNGCLSIPRTQATMNMGWRGDYARDLHELGHALGLIHEHQSPSAEIPWNKQAVYDYYAGPPNYWSRNEVDQQLFARYNSALITNSVWDGQSIMSYAIPREHVTDPRFAVGFNKQLSLMDKIWIAKLYPRKSK